jgi:hypothetical protein
MSLPKVIPLEEKKELTRMVICISKDIDELEEKILVDYGKVIRYEHDLHNNIDCDTLTFDYLIIDLRKKNDRYFYMKEILNKKDKYNVILYNYCFEENDFNCDNQINSFPKKQATKKDFDALLLIKRIRQPRAWVDFFRKCFGLYQQLK